MRITIVGHVCLDHNFSEGVRYQGAGSPAMFMARVYRHFPQVNLNIIAPYGRDYLAYLKETTIYPSMPQAEKTLVYENHAHGNTRTQKALNREFALPVALGKEAGNLLRTTDVLFLAPLLPNYDPTYVRQMLKLTNPNAQKILLPQGYYRNFAADDRVITRDFVEEAALVPLFDFVIVSDQDHAEMEKIAKQWAAKTRVIVTLGDNGAKYLYKKKTLVAPIKAVPLEQIVDSVGSGDIFSASFAYKYARTRKIGTALAFANNLARQGLFYSANNLRFTLPKSD